MRAIHAYDIVRIWLCVRCYTEIHIRLYDIVQLIIYVAIDYYNSAILN